MILTSTLLFIALGLYLAYAVSRSRSTHRVARAHGASRPRLRELVFASDHGPRGRLYVRIVGAGLVVWAAVTVVVDSAVGPPAAIWAGGAVVGAVVVGVGWASRQVVPRYTDDEMDAALRELLDNSGFDS